MIKYSVDSMKHINQSLGEIMKKTTQETINNIIWQA